MDKKSIYTILRSLADRTLPESRRADALRWLAADSDKAEKDEALFGLWNNTDSSSVSDGETRGALHAAKERLHMDATARRKGSRAAIMRTLMRYAAMLLLPLATGMAVWLTMQSRVDESSDMAECFVPAGKQLTITLPDSTRVTLNSGTMLVYPKHFHGSTRRVLLAGEGHFSVSHDSSMPFVISSGPINIKVVGTTFNVDAYPDDDDITVNLEEGCVNVFASSTSEKDGTIMHPNERLVYSKADGRMTLYRNNDTNAAAWTAGTISFDQQPLADIIRALERSYAIRIHYDSRLKTTDRYTLRFNRKDSIDDVMRILTFIIGDTSYKIQGTNVLLTKKRGGGTK